MITELLLATRSEGKLRELRPLFEASGFAVTDLTAAGIPGTAAEDAIEAFDTFEMNALAKARHFFAVSGRATVADDSGLSIDALGGRPGVRSKRWSELNGLSGSALDDANNAKMCGALAGVTDRRARYVCAAAFVDATREHVVRGESAGRIVDAPSGANGFGYDPYFVSDALGITFGDATREQKEAISHRGRAFRTLIAAIRAGDAAKQVASGR